MSVIALHTNTLQVDRAIDESMNGFSVNVSFVATAANVSG